MDESEVPAPPCGSGCGPLRSLAMIQALGVDHLLEDHDRVQVVVHVLGCDGCGAGRYWYFDHDCTGYPTSHALPVEAVWTLPIAAADVTRLRDGLRGCPDPADGRCGCPAHAALAGSQGGLRHRQGDPPARAAGVAAPDGLPVFRPL